MGKDYVGHFYNGPSTIALNRQWLNGELTWDYPNDAEVADTIAHEMLHTFGLDHPDGDWKAASGTFINEYGECIASLFGAVSDEYKFFSK